jgi:RNA polymerase sigma-70 factor (ECF subfamily)
MPKPSLAPAPPNPADRQARIRALVDEHIRFVARTLRNSGVPPSELDDEIQRVFMVVARRLEDVQPGSERRFLFQVAVNMAAHTRRNLARRREVPSEGLPELIEARATPEEVIDRLRMRRLLDVILHDLDESLRVVFALFEFEEMNMAEIAARLRLPRGTVASRLRRARAQLRTHVAAIELASDLGARDTGPIEEPASMRRGKTSRFVNALLTAGSSVPAVASAHRKTLAVLGLPAGGR